MDISSWTANCLQMSFHIISQCGSKVTRPTGNFRVRELIADEFSDFLFMWLDSHMSYSDIFSLHAKTVYAQTWEKLLSFHDPIFEVRKFPQKCVIRDISESSTVCCYINQINSTLPLIWLWNFAIESSTVCTLTLLHGNSSVKFCKRNFHCLRIYQPQ